MNVRSGVWPAAFVFVVSLCAAPSAEETAAIVSGTGYAFSVVAPRGWVLDTRSGRPDNLQAVFYPKGSSWTESDPVMYASGLGRNARGRVSFQDFLEDDLNRFQQDDPGIDVIQANPLELSDGRQAVVREFRSAQRHEVVAYIEEPKSFVTLVCSARTDVGLSRARPAFAALAKSYTPLAAGSRGRRSGGH